MKILQQIFNLLLGLSILTIVMTILGYLAFYVGPKLTKNDRHKKNN